LLARIVYVLCSSISSSCRFALENVLRRRASSISQARSIGWMPFSAAARAALCASLCLCKRRSEARGRRTSREPHPFADLEVRRRRLHLIRPKGAHRAAAGRVQVLPRLQKAVPSSRLVKKPPRCVASAENSSSASRRAETETDRHEFNESLRERARRKSR